MRRQSLPLARCRILIVEDEFIIAADLEQLIEGAGGIVVGPASSRAVALWLAHTEEFDIALLDVRLNDGTAADVARLFTARRLPFVVVTGYDRVTLSSDLVAAPYMQKPIAREDLVAVVGHSVGAGQQRWLKADR
jgi:DNA-binding NtrC family response regulator